MHHPSRLWTLAWIALSISGVAFAALYALAPSRLAFAAIGLPERWVFEAVILVGILAGQVLRALVAAADGRGWRRQLWSMRTHD